MSVAAHTIEAAGGRHDSRPVVLMYLTLPGSGEIRGGPRSILMTARHLQRYRPVFVLNVESSYADDVRRAGIEVRIAPVSRVLDGIRGTSPGELVRRFRALVRHDFEVLKIARETGAEILHCQESGEALAVGIATRLSGRQVVMHVRDEPRLSKVRLPFVFGAGVASRIIYIAGPLLDTYVRLIPKPLRHWLERRSVAIPNGIELGTMAGLRESRTRGAARAALGIDPASWLLTVIGPLTWKKNQLDLLEKAGQGLLELGDDVRLLFVGSERAEPAYSEKCHAAVSRLRWPERVIFAGELPHERMWDVYASTDVLLIPSNVEGLPRVSLEGQGFGCPIVASRNAGNVAAVVEGRTGYLIDLDRFEEYPAAVGRIRDPVVRQSMSEAAIEHAREEFDVDAVTPRVEAVYDRIRAVGSGAFAPSR